VSSPAREVDAEQQVQKDLYRLDAYRAQLNALVQQFQYLNRSRLDHVRARETLEGFERTGDGAELLIPVGAEAFVRGRPVETEKVLLGIGSGVVVEIERPKASETLSQRIDKIDAATTELEGQIRTLEERIQALSDRLETMSRGGSPGRPGGPDDVGRD